MTELMEWLQRTIDAVITALGYPGIALVMFAENVFPPIPSELVMPFAGFKVAADEMTFLGVMIAGTLGAVLGGTILYYVGMWSNEAIIRRFIRRYGKFFLLAESDIDKTLAYFDRHGHLVVFFGRLIPIVRSLISIPAGMNRMPLAKFLVWTTGGTIIWNLILTSAGYALGANWKDVLGFIDQYETVVKVLIVLGVSYFVVTRAIKWRRNGLRARMQADK